MYYRDQFGNVTDFYSTERSGQYSNAPGGSGYHPLSREDFTFHDVRDWFEKYKMWFVWGLLVVFFFIILMWLYHHNKYKHKKSAASVFY